MTAADAGAAPPPATRPVAAVIFDWGGTLTPWHDVDLQAQWRVFAEESALTDDETAELASRIHAAEEAGWRRGREGFASARIEEILAEAGVVADDPRALAGLTAYRTFWEPHTLTDAQVRPLWEALRERGIRIGVLSNTIWSRDYHRDVFDRDGVLELIDADVYSSETPWVKPAREIFLAAAAALGVEAAACVYVGDRSYEDVHGPQSAGMRAIWVPHSTIPASQQVSHDATPDAVVQDLAEILEVVERWQSR